MKRLALLLVLASGLYAEGFDGWGRVKWGATKAQVLEEYKAESAIEADSGVRIPEYRVGDDAFLLFLTFEDDGLSRVTFYPSVGDLTAQTTRRGQAAPPSRAETIKALGLVALGRRVESLLGDKYGQPTKTADTRGVIPNLASVWNLNGGDITLLLGYEPNAWPSIYKMRLIYERKNKALDKL